MFCALIIYLRLETFERQKMRERERERECFEQTKRKEEVMRERIIFYSTRFFFLRENIDLELL